MTGASGGAGPEMHSSDSSLIEAVGYDARRRELHLDLVDSGRYVYFDVDQAVVDGLLAAESKGQYFNHEIKPRGYRYERRG